MPKTTTFHTVTGLNKALRKLPKAAAAELRDASGVIAGKVADKARVKALGVGGAAKLVAPSIRVRRDRVPAVVMGSAKRLPPVNGTARTGRRQTVGDLIWGAEWGSTRHPQFKRRRQDGYFLWSTVDDQSDEIMDEYSDALLDALRKVK